MGEREGVGESGEVGGHLSALSVVMMKEEAQREEVHTHHTHHTHHAHQMTWVSTYHYLVSCVRHVRLSLSSSSRKLLSPWHKPFAWLCSVETW